LKYINNEYYHVYNRGANKARIFFLKDNYRHCLSLMGKYSAKHAVSILAYCLMPNHYHLVCRGDHDGSISKFLRDTFNAHTQAVNKQQRLSGTLFQGRARAKHITSDSYVVQVVRYIHLNPVEAGIVATPEEWKFSDYLNWIGKPCEDLKPSQGSLLRSGYFKNGDSYRNFVDTSYSAGKDQAEMKLYLYDE